MCVFFIKLKFKSKEINQKSLSLSMNNTSNSAVEQEITLPEVLMIDVNMRLEDDDELMIMKMVCVTMNLRLFDHDSDGGVIHFDYGDR